MHSFRLILCTAVVWLASPKGGEPVERWDTCEIALAAEKSYANPFTDVAVTATFRHSSGKTVAVDGFHDGEATWRVRFMPAETGTWTWSTSSKDPGLSGKTGALECVVPRKPFLHGPLQTRGHHFVHADGTPRFVISTRLSCVYAPPSVWPPTLRLLKDHQINRVFFMMPGVMKSKFDGRHLFAAGPDYTRYNLAAFRAIDVFIDALRREDLLASPYLYYFNDKVQHGMTPEHDRAYIRYALARFGAYANVLPVLSNEVEQKTSTKRDARYDLKAHTWTNEMGALLKKLAVFGPPVTVHNPMENKVAVHPGFFTLLKDWPFDGWTDLMLRQAQVGALGATPTLTDGDPEPTVPAYNERAYARHHQLLLDLRRFGKPIINEEPGYEMDGKLPWNSQTADTLRKTFWTATAAGAYVAWGSASTYELGDPLPKMLPSPTPRCLRTLHNVMMGLPFAEMTPDDAIVSASEVTIEGAPYRTNFGLARNGEIYLIYSLNGGSGTVTLRPGSYAATRIDPRDGARTELGSVPATSDFTLPAGDWVLVYRKN